MRPLYSVPLAVALLTFSTQTTLPRQSIAADVVAKADAQEAAQIEVLTRGPIHEGFATQFQLQSVAGATIDKAPPQSIVELPPDVRPVGANVQWLPGYWGWDADANDFLWVSGTYRNLPPGQRWLPGYWNHGNDGYQWMSGFFISSNTKEIKYGAEPPQSLERGPTSAPPSQNHFWIPGVYQPNEGAYAWRPGYWAGQNENYVWSPARNVATAGGYVHTPGFWDYQLSQRGTLFAPARVAFGTNPDAAVRMTPSVVIPATALQYHLFSRANSSTYLFGDYYGDTYAAAGIRPWYSAQLAGGVPDPLFGYSNWYYGRSGVNYRDVMTGWNTHFTTNVGMRPASTLAGQADLIAKLGVTNAANSVLGVNSNDLVSRKALNLVSLSAAERTTLLASTNSLQLLATQRLNLEGGVGGVLNVAGVGGTVNGATQALQLPAVPAALSVVGATTAGINPTLNGVTNGLVPGVTNGLVPGVTNGLVPGVTNGLVPGVTNGLVPGVLNGGVPNLPLGGGLGGGLGGDGGSSDDGGDGGSSDE